MISEPMERLAQKGAPTLCQYYHYLQTDRYKLSVEPHHLVVPSCASKMIPEPMVRLAHTVHICCTNTNNISNGTNKIPHDPRHLGVPTGASRTIYEPMVCLAQTGHLSSIKTNTISKRTKRDSTRPTSPRSSIGCVQNDF